MSRQTEAYIYKASNNLDTFVTGPNDRPLKMDYTGTVTLDGITYKTLKIGYREFYGTTFEEKHDYRQEWLLNNVSVPLGGGQDIELASLSSYDTECVYSSTASVRRRVASLNRPDGWWDDHFSCIYPRSILLPTGERLYNDAAIAAIDAKYKNLGWRVPCIEDLTGVVRYNGKQYYGHPAFPFSLIQKYDKLMVYGRTKILDTQTSPFPMPEPYTRLKLQAADDFIEIREPADKSDSTLNCHVFSTAGYPLVWSRVPYVEGTSKIKLRQLDYQYNFVVTRDIANIDAYTYYPDYTNIQKVRVGIKTMTDGYLVDTGGVPKVEVGYYMASQDFPTFYSVRLCRAPLKP